MNPPCRNPLDRAKYREQYLSSLALEASNQQLNLNANQIFKQTGQTPNALPDMRTTTEKYADIEGAKITIRSFLASQGIMSTHVANEVAQELTPTEVQFFLQYQEFIKTDFKGRGIPAQVFIAYLRKLMRKVIETKGVDYGLQQTSGPAVLLSNQQILKEMISSLDLEKVMDTLRKLPTGIPQSLHGLIDRLVHNVDEMKKIIPTPEDLQKIGELDPVIKANIYVLLNEALRDVPSKKDLDDELVQLSQAIEAHDFDSMAPIFRRLIQLLEVTDSQRDQISMVAGEITRAVQGGEPVVAVPVRATQQQKQGKSHDSVPDTVKSLQEWDVYHGDSKLRFLQKHNIPYAGKSVKEYDKAFESWLGGGSKPKGHGLKGKGLVKRKKPRPVERSTGYEKPKAFVQFGKYLLNRHKLDENILMVRRPCGGGINDLPTELISNPLVHIMKTLSGGGLPSYENIADLSHADKLKLHKVVKHTRFEKISVPHPQKTDNQKEMDRFDILKGEIMAGNDNKTIVKEFKVLVMKFIQEGRLPRRQGHEILTDLTSMGF